MAALAGTPAGRQCLLRQQLARRHRRLRTHAAKKTGQTFKAVVLEVRNFGMFIELPDIMAGGLAHVSALGDDFYTFDQARQRFIGRKKKKVYQADDKLEVVVARVDPFKQQLDFAPA